jgi:hypothetical protein
MVNNFTQNHINNYNIKMTKENGPYLYLYTFFFFYYSKVHTRLGSFLPPAPTIFIYLLGWGYVP